MIDSTTGTSTYAPREWLGYGQQYEGAPLSDRDIEEQATPEATRADTIDIFDERVDPTYLQSEYQEPKVHGRVGTTEPASAEAAPGHVDMSRRIESLGGTGIVKRIGLITPLITNVRRNEIANANN